MTSSFFFLKAIFGEIKVPPPPQKFPQKSPPFPATWLSFLIARLGNYFYDLETIVVGEDTDHGEPHPTQRHRLGMLVKLT
jgi:hypothetical protein